MKMGNNRCKQRIEKRHSRIKKGVAGAAIWAVCLMGNPWMGENVHLHAEELVIEMPVSARLLSDDAARQAVKEIRQKSLFGVIAEESALLLKKTVIYEKDYRRAVQYQEDETLYEGEQIVIQTGKKGTKAVTAQITYVNGEEQSREILAQKVVKQARPKIIAVGTKKRPEYMRPIAGGVTSSYFGPRWGEFHLGHDWAIEEGSEVMAAKAGTVTEAKWNDSYGYYVLVAHENGISTRYAHLSQLLAEPGQQVEQGEIIGFSGNTGNSTGPHLHFEVLKDGEQVEPLDFVKE